MDPIPAAMDPFPAGSFVRLRNRERDKYVCTDKDGISVSLRSLRAARSLNTVWKVEILPVDGGGSHLLLQSAAYGKYLASAHELQVVPRGYRGVPAIQRDYDLPHEDPPFLWTPFRVEEAGQKDYVRLHNDELLDREQRCLRANGKHRGVPAIQRDYDLPHEDPPCLRTVQEDGQDYIRLHNNELIDREQRCLRANGKHRRLKKRVTVDLWNADETKMMQWTVKASPSTAEPIPLPPPPPPPRRGLFRRRTEHPGRRIWHFQLNDDGNPVTDEWPDFVFHDNSVSNLRTEVAEREHDENITLGVRAGYNARVIPLVTDLHNDFRFPMQIIVYTTGSQAYIEWMELSDPSSESDDSYGDPTYIPNEGNEDGQSSDDAGDSGNNGDGGDSSDGNDNGSDDEEDDSHEEEDDDDDDDDDDDIEEEEDSDYEADFEDDDDDYLALLASQPALPEGAFTAHGVTYVNYLSALPGLNPEVHILGFGPILNLAQRIKLWQRAGRLGFDFEPTEMLRWVWRIDLLLQGRNPGNLREAPSEPPVPNPGDYSSEGWTTDEEV